MKPCCKKEAKRHIKKHRDVARCDQCDALILGYGNEIDYHKMIQQLEESKISFETATQGSLRLVIKSSR